MSMGKVTYSVYRLIEHSRVDVVFPLQEARQEFWLETFRDTICSDTFEPCLLSVFLAHSFALALDVPDATVSLVSVLQFIVVFCEKRFSLWRRR